MRHYEPYMIRKLNLTYKSILRHNLILRFIFIHWYMSPITYFRHKVLILIIYWSKSRKSLSHWLLLTFNMLMCSKLYYFYVPYKQTGTLRHFSAFISYCHNISLSVYPFILLSVWGLYLFLPLVWSLPSGSGFLWVQFWMSALCLFGLLFVSV